MTLVFVFLICLPLKKEMIWTWHIFLHSTALFPKADLFTKLLYQFLPICSVNISLDLREIWTMLTNLLASLLRLGINILIKWEKKKIGNLPQANISLSSIYEMIRFLAQWVNNPCAWVWPLLHGCEWGSSNVAVYFDTNLCFQDTAIAP